MPNQLKYDAVYSEIAQSIATFSNCIAYKVGAIIVKDGRIVSTGYNGTPPGFMNCSCKFHGKKYEDVKEDHHKFSEIYEVHAEQNAIIYAAKYGISIDNGTMYTTLRPCNTCLKMICQSGIKRVVYGQNYSKSSNEEDVNLMLKLSNVIVEKY